jgi:FkbM family methyltransferase
MINNLFARLITFLQERGSTLEISTLLSDLNYALKIIKNCGLEPQFVIDVGAHKGTWTSEVQNIFPDSKFLLIEPQELPISNNLKAKNITWMRIGLGPNDKVATFYNDMRTDSSSFKVHNPNRVIDQNEISMRRLDTLVAEHRLEIPDIVKLDCEGYDIEVLKGFGNLLGKIPFIFMECGVSNLWFKNNIVECVSFMESHNYRLINVGEAARLGPSWAMWNAELLFVLDNSKYSRIIQEPNLD